MVRRSLIEEPGISDRTLYAAAAALEPSIGELTFQQFQARYPRRVRRMELGRKKGAERVRDERDELPLADRPYVYAPGSTTLEPDRATASDSEDEMPARETVAPVDGRRRVRRPGPQSPLASETASPDSARIDDPADEITVDAEDAGTAAEPWPLRLHPGTERPVPPKRGKPAVRRIPVTSEWGTALARTASARMAAEPRKVAARAPAARDDGRRRLRDGIRRRILEWARELAYAETRGEIVGVLAGVDGHVDAITRLLAGGGADATGGTTSTSSRTSSSAGSALAAPAERPPVRAGKLARSYKPAELDAMVRWVMGSRAAASDEEIVQTVVEELGFKRRGQRITRELLDSLRRVRGG